MFSFGQTGDLFDRGLDQLMTYMGEMGGIAEKDNKALPNADRLLPDDVPEESVGEGGSHDNFGMFDSNPFGAVNLAASFPEGSCEPQLVPCAQKPAATTTTTNDVADSVADGAFGSPDAFSSPDGFASEDFNLSFGMDDVDAMNQQDLRYNLMLRGAGLAEHSTADAPSHPKMEFPEYPAHHPMNHPMYPPHMPLYYPGMPTMPVPYYGMPYPPFAYNPWMTPYSSPFMPPQHAMPGTSAMPTDPAAIARQRRLVADSVRGKRRRHAHHASSQLPSAASSAMPSVSGYGHPFPSSPSMLPWTHVNPEAADSVNTAPPSPFVPAAPLPPFSPAVVPSSPKAVASPARCASPVPASSPTAVGKGGAGKAAAKSPLGRSAPPAPAAAAAAAAAADGKSPAVKFSAEADVVAAPAATLPVSPVLKIEEDVFVPTATAPVIPAIAAPAGGQQAKGGKAAAKQQRDERRVKRLLRNRVSAQQARERKKNYVSELEQRCETVERSNAEIEGEIAALMAENERLRQSMRRAIRHRKSSIREPGGVGFGSVFFHRIALCGYEFEHAHPFCPHPAFPYDNPFPPRPSAPPNQLYLISRPASSPPCLLPSLALRLSLDSCVSLPLPPPVSPPFLFRPLLTECVLSDTRLALLSSLFFCLTPASTFYSAIGRTGMLRILASSPPSLFFCLTPASTFYSAIYSESLFALLSFAAMWRVVSGRWFSASLLIALSAAVRSNGVLHAGFFLFSLLQVYYHLLFASLPLCIAAGVFSLQVYYHLLFASLPLCITAGVCLLHLASVHSLPHNLPQPNTELTGSALAPLPLPPCLHLSFNQQFPHPTSVAVAVQCCQAARAAGPFILPLLPFQLLQRLINAVKKQGSEPREQHPPHKSSEKRAERRVAATERAADRIGPLLERKRQLCRKRLLPILLSTALCCLLSFSLLLSFQFFPFTQFCRPAASTRTSPASGYSLPLLLTSSLLVATRFLSSPPPLYWFLAHLLTSGHSKQSQSKPPSPSPHKYLPFELQVATRFLSSSPPLYWLLAHLLTSGGNSLPLLLTSSLLVPGTCPHIGKYRAL
ncbi:unnamed protein product [Closterium sp. NIES-65]|nr:unnamed protein product [Closterium sp. NIES-65]